MSHDETNAAFAARLSARGLKARALAFYREELRRFALAGSSEYAKALPTRLKASAWRALPWIGVTAVVCSMVSCTL